MLQPSATLQFDINPAALDNPALEFLRHYWNEKRGNRTMPSRADMQPRDFKQHLDSIAIVDVLDEGAEFRYRVVGTLLTQYFMLDPTGKTLSQAWARAPESLAMRVRANLASVVHRRAVTRVWGSLNWPRFPKEPIDALFLPLSDDGERVNMILNLFTFQRSQVLLERQIARERGEKKLLPEVNEDNADLTFA